MAQCGQALQVALGTSSPWPAPIRSTVSLDRAVPKIALHHQDLQIPLIPASSAAARLPARPLPPRSGADAGWRQHRQKDVKRVGADLCRPPEVLERLLSSEQIVGESWRFPSVLQVISRIGLCPRRTSAKWTRTRPASRRVTPVLQIQSRAAAAPTSRRTRSAGRLKD